MSKEVRNKVIILALLVVIACCSIFVVEPWITSEKHNEKSVTTLDEKKENVLQLTAASTTASAIITVIPGDAGTPIAEKLADLSSCFLIVLCAIYLEKFLLPVTGYLAFKWLIPLACLLFGVFLFYKNPTVKRLAAKLAVFGLAISLVIPASVKVSSIIEDTYADSIQATIDAATVSTEDVGESSDDSSDEETTGDEDEKETETSETSEEQSTLGWIAEKLGIVKDTINDAAETVADTASEAVSSKTTELIEKAKTILNNFIEAAAVMMITSCVIPMIVLLFFFWLVKIILEINVGMPGPGMLFHGPGPKRGPKHGPGFLPKHEDADMEE